MKVKSVKYISGYTLKVEFDNEETKIIDFKNFLQKARNPMSTKYKNIILFQNVEIDTGFLSWNKGEMEISAESLYFNRV